MVARSTTLLLTLVSLPLAACGDGAVDVDTPIQVVNPPSAPSGTIPPPVGITYPKAPSAITAPITFVLLESIFPSAVTNKIPAGDLTLRWLGQPATYGLAIAGIGEGELRQSSANDPALQLVGPTGQILMTSLDVPQAQGRYSGLLRRYSAPFIDVAFGVDTPSSAVPSTGKKAYSPVPQGHGVKLTIDFATRQVSGTVDLAWEDAWGPYEPTTYTLTPSSFAPGATNFSASFTIPGAPAPGQLVGRFSGPNAEEIMVSWRGQVKSPYDDSWVEQGGITILTSTS